MPERSDLPDELLERFRQVDISALWSGVNRLMRGPIVMENVRSTSPGTRLVGRARTLRYMPTRRITALGLESKQPPRDQLPEYLALSRCGPGDVLVMDCQRRTAIGHVGDVKAFALKQNGAEGLVTDGSIRDLPVILADGIKVFTAGYAIPAGIEETDQYDENIPIACAGVLVNPGDIIVGDDLGVMVVPQEIAELALEFAEEHGGAEEYIKELAVKESVVPWTYYPPSAEFVARYKREKLGQP